MDNMLREALCKISGPLNQLLVNFSGEDGESWITEFKKFLRKEKCWIHSWYEKDGVIYFSVTSDGTTGSQWIKRLEKKGFRIGDYAKSVLLSSDFKPTNGVTTEVAVLKGMLFKNDDRVTKNIRAEADRRNLTKPNAEVACLIREKFSDEEIEAMGLWWIVVMHESINDSDGVPDLLGAHRYGDGRGLDAYFDRPGLRWDDHRGFAFAVSQV